MIFHFSSLSLDAAKLYTLRVCTEKPSSLVKVLSGFPYWKTTQRRDHAEELLPSPARWAIFTQISTL